MTPCNNVHSGKRKRCLNSKMWIAFVGVETPGIHLKDDNYNQKMNWSYYLKPIFSYFCVPKSAVVIKTSSKRQISAAQAIIFLCYHEILSLSLFLSLSHTHTHTYVYLSIYLSIYLYITEEGGSEWEKKEEQDESAHYAPLLDGKLKHTILQRYTEPKSWSQFCTVWIRVHSLTFHTGRCHSTIVSELCHEWTHKDLRNTWSQSSWNIESWCLQRVKHQSSDALHQRCSENRQEQPY